jgi:hypothetical protein
MIISVKCKELLSRQSLPKVFDDSSVKFKYSYLLIALLQFFSQDSLHAKPKGETVGRVQTGELQEISGITTSHINPGVVWLHNDGPTYRLFALRTTGQTVGVLEWPNAMVDFEDVASGPGPEEGKDYLYISDIGDNDGRRPQVRVYRTLEPILDNGDRPEYLRAQMEDFRLTYPDGQHDAEALLVDPISRELLIATKEKKSTKIYHVPLDELKPKQPIELKLLTTLGVGSISGGDISRDGRWFVLRSEKEGWLWPRDPERNLILTFSTTLPQAVPVRAKPQAKNGEAIAIDASSTGYYTISEGEYQPLKLFPLPPWGPNLKSTLSE